MRGCLENLLEQTLHRQGLLEIVVIDSASPEGEGEIVRKFQKKSPHIRYVRTSQRETLYAAWNRGVELASAPIVANANTDDRYAPDGLERLVKALEDAPDAGFAYGDTYLSRAENETFAEHPQKQVFATQDFCGPDLLLHHFPGHQIAWRKGLHIEKGGFDPSFRAAGDYDFFLRLAQRAKGLHITAPLGLRLVRSDAITFRDETMILETSAVLQRYRNIYDALALYRIHGIETENPDTQCACFLDLSRRALSFYPQWGNGRPDCDLAFAGRSLEWAESTGASEAWCTLIEANRSAIKALEQCSPDEKVEIATTSIGLPEIGCGLTSIQEPFAKSKANVPQSLAHPLGVKIWQTTVIDYWLSIFGVDKAWFERVMAHSREQERPLFIWGASERGKRWRRLIEQSKGGLVAGFIDSNQCLAGAELEGLPIYHPDEFGTRAVMANVLVATGALHWMEISETLRRMGCNPDSIFLPSNNQG